MIEEGGYSICKCRFRFGLTFRSSLPREPAIEATSFQTMNKCPAKRLLKAPLLLHPFYFFSLNHRDNVYGTGPLISRHISYFSHKLTAMLFHPVWRRKLRSKRSRQEEMEKEERKWETDRTDIWNVNCAW